MNSNVPRSSQINVALLFAAILAIIGFAHAAAQTPSPGQITDDQVNAVARQLYCPVCENTPLDVCPTQACEEWRELIRQKLAEGWNSGQIRQYFVEQYGDRVLPSPPPSGFNWLIYIIPPLTILIGGFILFRSLQSWRQPAASTLQSRPQTFQDSENPIHDEYFSRLEEELKKR